MIIKLEEQAVIHGRLFEKGEIVRCKKCEASHKVIVDDKKEKVNRKASKDKLSENIKRSKDKKDKDGIKQNGKA